VTNIVVNAASIEVSSRGLSEPSLEFGTEWFAILH
jgi:hypothetical protein